MWRVHIARHRIVVRRSIAAARRCRDDHVWRDRELRAQRGPSEEVAVVSFVLAQVKSLEEAAPTQSLTQDSAILAEQFYFFTVVFMWLIHAGFMSYEAGVARRKNLMTTAMKNILTIAVVT